MAAPLISQLVSDLKSAKDPSAQIQQLLEYEPRMDVISGLMGALSGECSEAEARRLLGAGGWTRPGGVDGQMVGRQQVGR